jgi:tetratricopeptide (TPR) repeat protein
MDRAVELEPYFWVIQNLNAWIYYFEEKYDKSIEACRIARDLYKNYIQNNWLSFLNFARLGEGEKAAAELVTLLEKNPASKPFATEIPEVYKKSGIPGLFNWLIDINLHRPVRALAMSGQPFFVAWWYAILGDRENSMLYLEKNMETVDRAYFFLNLMATNPDFDLLRGNPRFKKMMKEIGLAAYDIRKAR